VKNILWIGLILLMLGVWTWQQFPDGKLRLIFCDVGQGDGAVISLGYFQAMIDTGESGEKILDCLSDHMPYWDKRLEVVFLSHPDSDHAGALPEIERSYEVGRVIRSAGLGDIVRIRDLQFEVLSRGSLGSQTGDDGCETTNECSMVIRVVYKKFSGLFTGDMGEKEELALLGRGVIKESDVLKVAHHGSKFSSTIEFLETLRPELAVISVGAKNRYGHPTSDTLSRLDAVGAKVMRTDERGTIEVVTDGEQSWVVKK